jgi:pyrimidine operon attenuation protein / uracil phosphoribosyltransferase
MNAPAGTRTCLHDPVQAQALIERMARQAWALLADAGPVAVVGVLRRGAPLADRLSEALVRRYGLAPPLRLDLKVKRYADDLTLLHPETRLTEAPSHADLDLSGHTLLVVDDVLYTGHSLLRVVQYLEGKRPMAIRVAVLADRGVTRLPVRADIVGARLDIAPDHIIECHVPPYEPVFQIELLQPARVAVSPEQA